jgi:GNAT superfamily N-acetyltransferase
VSKEPGLERTIKEYEPTDAQGVAEMWNACDPLWPDGFTAGIPFTAERIRLWHEYDKSLATFVAMAEGKAVGYCSLHAFWSGENAAYVGLLGVHPDALSRGLGKALLLKCVERTCQVDRERLDLHTWPGNERAMPPYKKTGFFWVPETWVYMQNYIPLILKAFPDYFADTDWYECFQREVTMAADDVVEDGVGLYPYRWKKDGQQLTVWIDRAARGMCGFETNELLVRCSVEGGQVIGGLPARVRWTLVNKGGDPLPVTIVARGSEKAKLEKDMALSLVGQAQLEAQLTTEPDFSSDWKDDRTAAVTTTLFLGDRPFTLKAGVVGRPAIAVETEPSSLSCLPGRPEPVYLRLHNHLSESASAQIGMATEPGLSSDLTAAQVELPAESLTGLPLSLTAEEAGVHTLRVQPILLNRDEPWDLKPTELRVVAPPIGGVAGYLRGEQGLLENESLRVTVSSREGGKLRVFHKASGRRMVEQGLNVGPPFWPSDVDWKTFPLRLEEEAGRMRATVSITSDAFPGLTIERSVSLSANPLIAIRHTLINSSSAPVEIQLLLGHNSGQWQAGEVALPLREGLVVDSWPGFPDWRDPADQRLDAFSEGWASLTRFAQTLGFLWADAERIEFGDWEQPYFALKPLTIPAQAHLTAPDFYLFAGPGNWQPVREAWKRLLAPEDKPRLLRPQPSFQVRTVPQPLVLMDGQGTGSLEITSLHSRRLEVDLEVDAPETWSAEVDGTHFSPVYRGQPARTTLRVHAPRPEPGIDQAILRVRTPAWEDGFPIALLSLGSGQEVKLAEGEREGQQVIEVDNDWMRFAVAPGFRGKVIALEHGGANHLWSSFPTPGSWSWARPWYGGLGPLMRGGERPLWFFDAETQIEESFDAQPLAPSSVTPMSSGIPWAGVQLRTTLQHRDLRGLQLELDYLTVGRSNLLAVITRLINPTTAPFRVSYRLDTALRLGGSVEDARLHRTWGPASKRLVNQVWDYPSGDWAAVESPSTGLWAVMVNGSQGCQVETMDMAHYGAHLGNALQGLLPPESTTEAVTFLVLTQDPQQARLYAALRDMAP